MMIMIIIMMIIIITLFILSMYYLYYICPHASPSGFIPFRGAARPWCRSQSPARRHGSGWIASYVRLEPARSDGSVSI